MKVRFGIALNGEHSWAKERLQPKDGKAAWFAQHPGHPPWPDRGTRHSGERTIAHRRCFKRAYNGACFYSALSVIDKFRITGTLLARLNELFVHGWTGAIPHSKVQRWLTDTAGVEAQLESYAQALRRVMQRLVEGMWLHSPWAEGQSKCNRCHDMATTWRDERCSH